MAKRTHTEARIALISLALMLACYGKGVAGELQRNVNLPGMDYKNFNLTTPDPSLCEQACNADPNCKAFTYVKPGIQGREARCWLKSGVPRAARDACCVSGVKELVMAPAKESATPIPIPGPQLRPGSAVGSPPKLGPRLEQFQTAVANQFKALAAREEQMNEARFAQVGRDIHARVTTAVSTQAAPGATAQPSDIPRVASVYPEEFTPGTPVLIKGSDFPVQPEVVLYDPTGNWLGLAANNTPSNAVKLMVTKASSSTIEAKIPKIINLGTDATYDRLSPIKGPRSVLIRIWDSAKQQYGTPSLPLTLKPNMSIYVCVQQACFPVKIEKNDTQVIWQPGSPIGGLTGTVFHLAPDSPPAGKGTDVLLQNFKAPQWWTLVAFNFDHDYFCFDQKKGAYEAGPEGGSCAIGKRVTLDQDVNNIDGQTSLPKVSVSWEVRYPGGIAYSYALYLRGPEGLGSIPFP